MLGAALKTAVAFTSQSTNAHCSETRKFVKELNNSYKHGKYLEVEKQLLKRSGLLLHPEFQSRLGSHVECINGIKHPKCSQVYCFQVRIIIIFKKFLKSFKKQLKHSIFKILTCSICELKSVNNYNKIQELFQNGLISKVI